jgi:hypothetical protein
MGYKDMITGRFIQARSASDIKVENSGSF